MSDAPSDVLHEILCRVPAESLLRFRTVCKSWKCIIDDPSFIQLHTRNLQQHSLSTILITESKGGGICSVSLDRLKDSCSFQIIDVDPFKKLIHGGVPRLLEAPAASCNGLILISNRRICTSWAIWNPLTRYLHEIELPQPRADFPSLSGRAVSVGFGYDAAADDYKVVRIDRLHPGGVIVHYRTLVYSMKLRSWRKIQNCPYDISFVGDGVFLNGALHWQSRDGITALHLGKEEYSLLPRPHPLSWPRFTSELLDALDGYLFLSYYPENKKGLDVWVMRDYGVDWSWMKLCSIDILSGVAGGLRPVAYVKSKRQVFLEHCGGGLFWLDLEKNSVKEVAIEGHRSVSFSQFSPGSLVRLDNSDSVVVKRPRGGAKRKRNKACARLKLKFCLRDTVHRVNARFPALTDQRIDLINAPDEKIPRNRHGRITHISGRSDGKPGERAAGHAASEFFFGFECGMQVMVLLLRGRTQLPQAADVAYSLKMDGKEACVVAFTGDGGTSEVLCRSPPPRCHRRHRRITTAVAGAAAMSPENGPAEPARINETIFEVIVPPCARHPVSYENIECLTRLEFGSFKLWDRIHYPLLDSWAGGRVYKLRHCRKGQLRGRLEDDGAEGDFHIALNFAAVMEAPVMFICRRNNGWAISTLISQQFRSS
ncbi:hypothetical protein C2S53_005269 [Perilla frutescens var. hirtella]|uniref:F-box domain-containing protein n=1 Tax=Perilla frutescens var. hirtella TaxID=608512 RepID=A0AAD4P6D2_PERFH|nr:hypothetical protein C2S53_005269 [Perilla frutescens var. hirtella]